MTNAEQRFEFGRNWHDFIQKNFGEEAVAVSKKHMLGFLERSELDRLSVLDIGCGSGLHSIAALEAGASVVHGFDYDPDSVAATRYVQAQVGHPANWTVEQGSVLDDAFMARLPTYDLVYSWGVLHHTGAVWHAIENAGQRVKPGGLFYIALYSADVQIDPTPEFWLAVKRRYVAGGWCTRRWLDLWYIWRFYMGKNPLRLPQFLRIARDYKTKRGMNVMTDVRDWLGGWPMEFCYDEDVKQFVAAKLDMDLVKTATGEANTEFLFRRRHDGGA